MKQNVSSNYRICGQQPGNESTFTFIDKEDAKTALALCSNVSNADLDTGVEPFLVQIHPPLTFSDYFAPCICPKRCAGFLARKRKKPASVWL